MTDHAVFVQLPEGPMGGVVSEPSGTPRAGMLFMQGYGRPARSGINSFWARLARECARRGLVVLRVDYAGEGETLPLGERARGTNRTDLDERLVEQVVPWFRERLDGLDLFLAGSCSGARGVVELAGRDHPSAIARTFLIVPHLRVLEGPGRPATNSTGHAASADDPGAVDPMIVDYLRTILRRAPSWILIGEHDTQDIAQLERMLGPTEHALNIEVVPNTALHFLDQPTLQEQVGQRLLTRVERALTEI